MQWEYSIASLSVLTGGVLKAQLDEKGRDGWQLVTILDEGSGKVGVFKRAVSPVAHVASAA